MVQYNEIIIIIYWKIIENLQSLESKVSHYDRKFQSHIADEPEILSRVTFVLLLEVIRIFSLFTPNVFYSRLFACGPRFLFDFSLPSVTM